jgi:hypothetical protein
MGKTKAPQADSTAKSAAPTVQPQPKLPEKQAGQMRVARMPMSQSAAPGSTANPGDGAPNRARNMMALQQSVGNARAGSMMRAPIQAKLTVNTPGDAYEQEADQVARQVVQQGEQKPVKQGGILQRLMRREMNDGQLCPECAKKLQREPNATLCPSCQAKLQRRTNSTNTPEATPEIENQINSKRGGGQPLGDHVRAPMEQGMGADFSGVKIHTASTADQLTRSLDARAFTTGQDIYFKQGEFNPGTSGGRELLAHELTHTVQQRGSSELVHGNTRLSEPGEPLEREAEAVSDRMMDTISNGREEPTVHVTGIARVIARQPSAPPQTDTPAAPPAVDTGSVKESVDAIIKDLEGITTRWASARIVGQFQGKGAAIVRALIDELKSRGPEHKETAQGMIDWLLSDVTAEDRGDLRKILIAAAVPDMARMVALQLKDLLEGPTSDADSQEIHTTLAQFGGPMLDNVFGQLEGVAGKDRRAMAAWFFGDMERVAAERLRQHLFKAGGSAATTYAIEWTATQVMSLLSGYTSHSDSSSIVRYFTSTPEEYYPLLQQRLNDLTMASRSESAEDALIKDMDRSDYEQLQKLGGLKLRIYDIKPSTLDKAVSGAEWAMVFLEWTICGVIGIATGLLAAIWDLIKGVWDIGKAAWHLLWSLIYLLSGGSAGSENWLAVKTFFAGLKELGSPGKVWDNYWENLKLEFTTIEGPLADCRMAEFVVRKFIGAVVNILLVFVGGYGIAKAAVSAARGAAELAMLAREIGVLRALAQLGSRAAEAARTFVAVSLAEANRIAGLILHPVRTLISVGRRLNVILLALEEEGTWAYLRRQAGTFSEAARGLWSEKKDAWKARAEKRRDRHGKLSGEADDLEAGLKENKAPEKPDSVAKQMDEDAAKLRDEVDDLDREVKGQSKEEGKPPQATQEEGTAASGQGPLEKILSSQDYINSQAKAARDFYPNHGGAVGSLVVEGESPMLIKSGVEGGPSGGTQRGGIPRGEGYGFTSGGSSQGNIATHVEGHSAAIMWQRGFKQAVLIVDRPECSICSNVLPSALPPGSQLTVVSPGGSPTIYRSTHGK